MKVRCIDMTGLTTSVIQLNGVYTVTHQYTDPWGVISYDLDVGGPFKASRFVEVKDMTDKYYNLWRSDKKEGVNRWVKELYAFSPSYQNEHAPQKLSYVEARKCQEYWRARFPEYEVWVREIAEDGISPGSGPIGFNVYMVALNRWTNASLSSAGIQGGGSQITIAPYPLNYLQAIQYRDAIGEGEIREIGSDLSPQPVFKIPVNVGVSSPMAPEVPTEPIPAPMEPAIDFDLYNGFRGIPDWLISMKPSALEREKIDLYTGLPKKKE